MAKGLLLFFGLLLALVGPAPLAWTMRRRTTLQALVSQANVITVCWFLYPPNSEQGDGGRWPSSPALCRVEQVLKGQVDEPTIWIDYKVFGDLDSGSVIVPEERFLVFLTDPSEAGRYQLVQQFDASLPYDTIYSDPQWIDPEWGASRWAGQPMNGAVLIERIRQLLTNSDRVAGDMPPSPRP